MKTLSMRIRVAPDNRERVLQALRRTGWKTTSHSSGGFAVIETDESDANDAITNNLPVKEEFEDLGASYWGVSYS